MLKRELEYYQNQGIPFTWTVSQARRKPLQKPVRLPKNGVYMRDYAEDEAGHISCVSFDFVGER